MCSSKRSEPFIVARALVLYTERFFLMLLKASVMCGEYRDVNSSTLLLLGTFFKAVLS